LTAEAFSTFGFSTFTLLAEDRKDIRCVNKLSIFPKVLYRTSGERSLRKWRTGFNRKMADEPRKYKILCHNVL